MAFSRVRFYKDLIVGLPVNFVALLIVQQFFDTDFSWKVTLILAALHGLSRPYMTVKRNDSNYVLGPELFFGLMALDVIIFVGLGNTDSPSIQHACELGVFSASYQIVADITESVVGIIVCIALGMLRVHGGININF